jgi:hypothetical protein
VNGDERKPRRDPVLTIINAAIVVIMSLAILVACYEIGRLASVTW